MLEQLRLDLMRRRPWLALALGFVYVFVAYASAWAFFGRALSITSLFLITLLLTPTALKLLKFGECRERMHGLRYFFRNHRDVFEIYLLLSLGVFLGFLALGLTVPLASAFDYQLDFLDRVEGMNSALVQEKLGAGTRIDYGDLLGLLDNNLGVAALAFVLSLFYGAGAIFLIVLNASVFATFVLFVAQYAPAFSSKVAMLGIFMVHMLPELAGFILAAIAGGVLSKAITVERFGSLRFRNVALDAAIIFFLSAIVIAAAAALESYVSVALFNAVLA